MKFMKTAITTATVAMMSAASAGNMVNTNSGGVSALGGGVSSGTFYNSGSAGAGGNAANMGASVVDKSGYGGVDLTRAINTCNGDECDDNKTTGVGYAGEHLTARTAGNSRFDDRDDDGVVSHGMSTEGQANAGVTFIANGQQHNTNGNVGFVNNTGGAAYGSDNAVVVSRSSGYGGVDAGGVLDTCYGACLNSDTPFAGTINSYGGGHNSTRTRAVSRGGAPAYVYNASTGNVTLDDSVTTGPIPAPVTP